jgi:hypothetical protein
MRLVTAGARELTGHRIGQRRRAVRREPGEAAREEEKHGDRNEVDDQVRPAMVEGTDSRAREGSRPCRPGGQPRSVSSEDRRLRSHDRCNPWDPRAVVPCQAAQ